MAPAPSVRFSGTVVLAAPPHEVYDYVTNPAQWRHWHPPAQRVLDSPWRPLLPGEQVTERIRVAFREFDAVWRVAQWERPARFGIEARTPQGASTVTYALEPLGEGCKFTQDCEFHTSGIWRLFDANLTRWLLERQARQALANLHAHFL